MQYVEIVCMFNYTEQNVSHEYDSSKNKKTNTIQVCIILTAIKLIRFAFHTINSLQPAVGMPLLQLYNFK